MPHSIPNASVLPRRTFLVASTVGVAGWAGLGTARESAATGPQPMVSPAMVSPATGSQSTDGGRAKSTILFFLCGGSSHIDMWDLKPDAPDDYRGPFRPIETSAPGVRISEHLPLLAKQAHHLALIRSVSGTVNTNDHHAGYYHNLTGHVPDPTFLTLGNNRTPMPDDWPYMGSVVAAKRPPHPDLPNAITLPYKPSQAPYTRPGQFAGKLGIEHDPLYVFGDFAKPLEFHAPSLVLSGDMSPQRMTGRHELLREMDQARREFERVAASRTWTRHQDRALKLLLSSRTTEAFQVAREPAELRERYGQTVNGMSLLLARRLVEAGVPFVTVFWMGNDKVANLCKSGGGWDTHGNNFGCLKDLLLPEFDQGFSALIEDLANRDLLDQTLLMVTSEMGRKPKIGDPRSGGVSGGLTNAGRDHWTHCLTDVLAGGGIRGGQTYGTTDRFAQYPADLPVKPADVTKTVYHAMGVHDLQAQDREGRPFSLLAEGKPIRELF